MNCRLILALSLIGTAIAVCPNDLPGLELWSDPQTWDTGLVPGTDHDVTIDKPILLNTETDRLASVTIVSGGKLIFDPQTSLSKLTSGNVLIDDGGELWIGSSDCKFDGKAEVLLTGSKDDDAEVDVDFGQKFIGVKEGGSLEIHGKDKKSWSMLSKTVVPHSLSFKLEEQPSSSGVLVYEFDRNTGELIFETGPIRSSVPRFWKWVDDLKESSVIVLLTRGAPKRLQLFEKIESVNQLGRLESAFALIKEAWKDIDDSWIFVLDKDDNGIESVYQSFVTAEEESVTTTSRISQVINGILYRVENKVSSDRKAEMPNLSLSTITAEGFDEYELELVDSDLATWEAADKLVVASTDFDFNQAEEVEIVSVDGNKVKVRGDLQYMHYGDVYETIDMRAEVGLLTRNILIHGEMGNSCSDDTPACQAMGSDNFGGHTKAVKGFKAYNIEGAEFTNMGQSSVLGSYPIHFHMCHNTTENGRENPLIQSNSIHHCFSRCVTIHGSHGVHVKNNVAHDTRGHCYFLEDGGERETVFENNLGLTTRNGFLTDSDKQPSTFWLTSPLVTMVGNHAAGSAQKGVGIWYLFPDKPVGPSADQGFFQHREAKHTPITLFENNVAHSNGNIGLALFRRLREDHGILGCSTYNPREEPLNRRSELVPAHFNGFTGFKNSENVRMRATTSQLENFKLADAKVGIEFVRNMLDGYQLLKDSLIVAETPNIGKPSKIKVMVEGKWRWTEATRSYPNPKKAHQPVVGVKVHNEGPLHLHDVAFKNFRDSDIAKACAIKFVDRFRFGMGSSSSVKGLTFDFDEPDATRVCHDNLVTGDDETSMTFRDLDGTLTGTPGTSLVSPDSYLQDGLNCELRDNWNMTVCEGNFARFYQFPKPEHAGATYITKAGDYTATHRRRKVSYTIRSDVTVVMHYTESVPPMSTVRVVGIQKGSPVIVGFCLPKGAEAHDPKVFLNFEGRWHSKRFGNPDVVLSDTLEDLDSDSTGKNTFLDVTRRILYIKFIEDDERSENDLADCPGGNLVSTNCPRVAFKFKNLEGVDLTTAGTGICDE